MSESDESELSGETEESEEDSGMCLRNLSQIYFNFVSLLERSNIGATALRFDSII